MNPAPPKPPQTLSAYKESLSPVNAILTTIASGPSLLKNSTLSSPLLWSLAVSSALTAHRYRWLMQSNALSKWGEDGRKAVLRERAIRGAAAAAAAGEKKFDPAAYARLLLRRKLSNTFFGGFLVLFPLGFVVGERRRSSERRARDQAQIEALQKIGVVEATKENLENRRGREAEGSSPHDQDAFKPQWDGNDRTNEETHWWGKK